MDLKSLSSSSYFSEDIFSSKERQVGSWEADKHPKFYASEKSIASSFMERLMPGEYQTGNFLEHPESFLPQDQKANHGVNGLSLGTGSTCSHSLTSLSHVNFDQGTRSSLNTQPEFSFWKSNKVDLNDTQYESSLFSSSLSELFSRKLRLSANNDLYGHSVDTIASHYEEEELVQALEELEAQTIGNLLPNDDDLLSGLTNGFDRVIQANGGNDMEELDLFSSIGGMEMGDDISSSGLKNSEFAGAVCDSQLAACSDPVAGEPPSRTLFVRNIDSDAEDSELKSLFEQYGDIRTLYAACKHRGFVMISYYDIRAAQDAKRALQNRPLRGRKLDIHYSIPKDNSSEKDIDLGTLVVFSLDSPVSNDELCHIFGVYGEIKEIGDIPQKRHQKFIEFYDVRAAEAALGALNGSDISGKRIKVEPSLRGAAKRCMMQQIHPELEQEKSELYMHQSSPPLKSPTSFPGPGLLGIITSGPMGDGRVLGVEPVMRASSLPTAFTHGMSSSLPNTLPSLVSVKSVANQCGIITESNSQGQLKDIQPTSTFHPYSLLENRDGFTNGVHFSSPEVAANINVETKERADNMHFCHVNSNGHSMGLNERVFKSAAAGSGRYHLLGQNYRWSNSFRSPSPQPSGMMWPNSPSYASGICAAHPLPRLHGLPRSPCHVMGTVLPINNQHVGSAPAVNPPFWDRQHTYAGKSPETSGFYPGSLGNMPFSSNTPNRVDFVSHSMFPFVGGKYVDLPVHPKNVGFQSHNQNHMIFPGKNHMIPMINSFDTNHNDRARSRRNEGGSKQADNTKQYELDIDRIKRGEDNRTTLMIKNIPNKYTSKMLLAAIDESHKGTYDFIYLPIDFKNKCNVGYAFINMTSPSLIIPFYQAFNGKKWEKFNSEKVASLAYARIQGKAALIAHFQNSSLMNEDKRCRPILFNTDGPNAGDQVPFPMGVNVRNRLARGRNNTQEDNPQGSPPT
ncbi:hypothetical protein L6164_010797 [Bauhinia variegata]|uniref:Uncharacterized protein n=1 Tax=Bauhinia variegata TaxID=167791 RepID=A0ACB9P3I5_BAUVA|nr:hypothetical protein L6164_010797 [Bauhinia variegata]